MARFFWGILFAISSTLSASTYYVAPYGNDNSGDGSIENPWFTLNKAWTVVSAGDTIYMRGGTYNYGKQELTGKNGQAGNMIRIWAFPEEIPIIKKANTFANTYWPRSIITLSANFVHLKGLEICYNSQENNEAYYGLIILNGNDNICELLNIHHIGGTGLSIEYNSSRNLILNCDIHRNADPLSSTKYGNADGIGLTHIPKDAINTIKGCRIWWNSDDGLDTYGSDSRLFVDSCWVWNNGYIPDTYTPAGNGVGFKFGTTKSDLGNTQLATVLNCISYRNKSAGFHQNGALGVVVLINNTAYQNGTEGFWFGSYNRPHVLKNNVSYKNGSLCYLTSSSILQNNTFLINNTTNSNFTVTDQDFEGLDGGQLVNARNPSGDLPDIDFLKLSPESDMVDKGAVVGLPYYGSAPDLGHTEYISGSITFLNPVYKNSHIESNTPSILEITFSFDLTNILPASSSFAVKANNVVVAVNKVRISGTKVFLHLSRPIAFGEVVTFSYIKPTRNPLQTIVGEQVASITNQTVTNNVLPCEPVFINSVIKAHSPTRIEMNYNLILADITPSPSSFRVLVNSSTKTVTSVDIYNTQVILTLSDSIKYGDIINLSYTKPSINPIQTPDGGKAASLSQISVVNECSVPLANHPPSVFISSSTKGNSYVSPATVVINIEAFDIDGTISRVELYNGTERVGVNVSAPYSFTLKDLPTGHYSITAVAFDNLGSSSTSSVLHIQVTDPIESREYFNLYPNPNNGLFTVEFTSLLEADFFLITVFDLIGETVFKGEMLNEENILQIDLSHLNSGTYILMITTDKVLLTQKFIKV